MLDGLLASVIARELRLVPPRDPSEILPLDIPIEREPGERFHLASQALVGEPIFYRTEYLHKRPVVREIELLGPQSLKRIDVRSGPDKAWRVPCPGEFHQQVVWWCVGDRSAIVDMLRHITRIGGRRRHGCGRVKRWDVQDAMASPGFPLLLDGAPTRPLPIDWPGVKHARRAMRCLTYPYWMREREELCLCPP